MQMNSWNSVILICGNHPEEPEEVPMELHVDKEGSSPFYACPHYVPAIMKSSDKDCTNRLPITAQEKLVLLLTEKARNPGSPMENNLTGMKWSAGGVDYKVVEHKDGKFKVSVLNNKEIVR